MKKETVILILRILLSALTIYFWYDAISFTEYPPAGFYDDPFGEIHKVGVAIGYVIAFCFTGIVTIGWKWMTKDF